jgi:hypothetical protein
MSSSWLHQWVKKFWGKRRPVRRPAPRPRRGVLSLEVLEERWLPSTLPWGGVIPAAPTPPPRISASPQPGWLSSVPVSEQSAVEQALRSGALSPAEQNQLQNQWTQWSRDPISESSNLVMQQLRIWDPRLGSGSTGSTSTAGGTPNTTSGSHTASGASSNSTTSTSATTAGSSAAPGSTLAATSSVASSTGSKSATTGSSSASTGSTKGTTAGSETGTGSPADSNTSTPANAGSSEDKQNALAVSLKAPSSVIAGSQGTLTLTWTNTSSKDVAAPLLQVSATNAQISVAQQSPYASNVYLPQQGSSASKGTGSSSAGVVVPALVKEDPGTPVNQLYILGSYPVTSGFLRPTGSPYAGRSHPAVQFADPNILRPDQSETVTLNFVASTTGTATFSVTPLNLQSTSELNAMTQATSTLLMPLGAPAAATMQVIPAPTPVSSQSAVTSHPATSGTSTSTDSTSAMTGGKTTGSGASTAGTSGSSATGSTSSATGTSADPPWLAAVPQDLQPAVLQALQNDMIPAWVQSTLQNQWAKSDFVDIGGSQVPAEYFNGPLTPAQIRNLVDSGTKNGQWTSMLFPTQIVNGWNGPQAMPANNWMYHIVPGTQGLEEVPNPDLADAIQAGASRGQIGALLTNDFWEWIIADSSKPVTAIPLAAQQNAVQVSDSPQMMTLLLSQFDAPPASGTTTSWLSAVPQAQLPAVEKALQSGAISELEQSNLQAEWVSDLHGLPSASQTNNVMNQLSAWDPSLSSPSPGGRSNATSASAGGSAATAPAWLAAVPAAQQQAVQQALQRHAIPASTLNQIQQDWSSPSLSASYKPKAIMTWLTPYL